MMQLFKKLTGGLLFTLVFLLATSFIPQSVSAQVCSGTLTCCTQVSTISGPPGCKTSCVNEPPGCQVCSTTTQCTQNQNFNCDGPTGSDCEIYIPIACSAGGLDRISGRCTWTEPIPQSCQPGYSLCGDSTTCVQGCYYTDGGKTCTDWINELCSTQPGGDPPPSGCMSGWCTSPSACAAIPGSSQGSGAGYCSSAGDVRCCTPPTVTPTCGGWAPNNPPSCAGDGVFGYDAAHNFTCCSGLQMGSNGVCVCSVQSGMGCNIAINNLATFVPSDDPFTVNVTAKAGEPDGLGINPQLTISSSNTGILSLDPVVNGQPVSAGSTINQTAQPQTISSQKVTVTATVTSQGCNRPGDTLCNRAALCSVTQDVYVCSNDTPTDPTNLQPTGSISSTDPRISGNNVTLTWDESTIASGTVPVDEYRIEVYPDGGSCGSAGAFCGTVPSNSYIYTIPSGVYRITFSVTPVNTHACGGGTVIGDTAITTFQISDSEISGYFFLDNEAVCGATQWTANVNPATGPGYDPNYLCNGNLTNAQTAPVSPYYTVADEQNGYYLGNNSPRCNFYFRRNRSFQSGYGIQMNGVNYQYGWVTDGRMESGAVNPPGTRYLQLTNLQGASTFEVTVGMEDEVRRNTCASNTPAPGMRFRILCDGSTTLYDSGMMRIADAARNVKVDVTNCSSLQLVGTPQTGAWYQCNRGAWGNPRLTGYLKNGSVSPRTYQNAGPSTAPSITVTDIDSNNVVATLMGNNVGYRVNVPFWTPGGNNVVRATMGANGGTEYYCACGADPGDPKTCIRSGISSPQEGVNFFFSTVNLNIPSWFQVWGGQIYSAAASGEVIRSEIPTTGCTLPGCKPALSAFNAVSTNLSDGPVQAAGGTINAAGQITQRTPNVAMTELPPTNFQQGYQYFYTRYSLGTNPTDDFAGQHGSGASANKPGGNGVYFSQGNLRIDSRWNVGAGQDIVVFVDGDLTIDDPSNFGDLIRVQKGGAGNSGFLAFIVSGNIRITSSVGNTTLTNETPNLEGIFISDGAITVETSGASDKRFIGEGNFIGWGGVTLQRSLSSINNQDTPAELFIFRPEFIRDMPEEMKEPLYLWQEINP